MINGYPRPGKDTFIDFVSKVVDTNKESKFKWVYNHSSIQTIKNLSQVLGYDESRKDARDRDFLANFKKLADEAYDFTFNEAIRNFDFYNQNIATMFFYYVREPYNIQRMVDYCKNNNIRFVTVLIYRDNEEEVLKGISNKSDLNVEDYCYHVEIDNTGTLEDLEYKAKQFVELLSE